MYHADTGRQRVEGRIEMHLFAVNKDVALVAACLPDHIHAEEDLHKGALARAVFAAEAQHLTLGKLQVDICQNLVAEEIFFDIAHLQKRSISVCHICYPPKK